MASGAAGGNAETEESIVIGFLLSFHDFPLAKAETLKQRHQSSSVHLGGPDAGTRDVRWQEFGPGEETLPAGSLAMIG